MSHWVDTATEWQAGQEMNDHDKTIMTDFNKVLWCGPRIASLPLPRYVIRGDKGSFYSVN